jgi:hypothetical protein
VKDNLNFWQQRKESRAEDAHNKQSISAESNEAMLLHKQAAEQI